MDDPHAIASSSKSGLTMLATTALNISTSSFYSNNNNNDSNDNNNNNNNASNDNNNDSNDNNDNSNNNNNNNNSNDNNNNDNNNNNNNNNDNNNNSNHNNDNNNNNDNNSNNNDNNDEDGDDDIDFQNVDDFVWCDNVRPPREFHFTGSPGVKVICDEPHSPLSILKTFFTVEIIYDLVNFTNTCAQLIIQTPAIQERLNSTQRSMFKLWKDVDCDEIWVYICLLILMGIIKKPFCHMYWTTDPLFSTPI